MWPTNHIAILPAGKDDGPGYVQCTAWFHTREGVCYTVGMGTALYKALREAGVSDEIATAAAEDAGQTERLQRMEERLTRVEVTLRVLVGLAVAILLLQLQPFFS